MGSAPYLKVVDFTFYFFHLRELLYPLEKLRQCLRYFEGNCLHSLADPGGGGIAKGLKPLKIPRLFGNLQANKVIEE